MEYERKSFWWGFAGGALAAYTFVFLIITTIGFMTGLKFKDTALFLAVISGIFTLLILFGKVIDTTQVIPSNRTRSKKGVR